MRRAYIVDCRDKETEGMKTPVEVTFSFHPEEAYAWSSRETAQYQCPIFDSYEIRVDWAEGGRYVCKGFQVEEYSPKGFVIFCEGPFTFKASGIRQDIAPTENKQLAS